MQKDNHTNKLSEGELGEDCMCNVLCVKCGKITIGV